MPRVIYEMGGVSADGYVVGPDGRSDWSGTQAGGREQDGRGLSTTAVAVGTR